MNRTDFEQLVKQEIAKFERVLGRARVSVTLIPQECPKGPPCSSRDYGFCTTDGKIVFIERILRLSQPKIVGLLRHELGHAFDKRICDDGAEQRADDIAEYVTGRRINYDKNDVQTIGPGKYPRPKHLHK